MVEMNATDLTSRGFGKWTLFSTASERDLLAGLPAAKGVYVIIITDPQPRQRGISDIGYIGRAGNNGGLRGRVRQYFHPGPTQSTNIAMGRRISDPTLALRLGFLVTGTTTAAKRLESDLLLEFEAQHGELPPYNRQRALDLMSRIDAKEAAGSLGAPADGQQRAAPECPGR
jgi:hypothetical protein